MLAPNDLPHPAASISPDGAVEGYASLFGVIDQARDMVMPGAFAASLKQRGLRQVPMLFQHDPAEPIGVWLELTEDLRGLYARGRLIPEVMRARELLALLKVGTADGLSIGFRTVRGRTDPKTRIRRLDAIDLWELSLIECPAFVLTLLHALWFGHETGINGFASLSALLMTYFCARFGVLGVYVSGRTREKQTATTGELPPSILGELVKALVKKK